MNAYSEKIVKYLDSLAKQTDDPEIKDMLRIAIRNTVIVNLMEEMKAASDDDGK